MTHDISVIEFSVHVRVQIMFGIQMAMTSLVLLGYTYMVVLMGMLS